MAQSHEWDQWRFIDTCAMSFTGGAPVNVPGCRLYRSGHDSTSYTYDAGTASIADRNGHLLFYTDGEWVWDDRDSVTPNGRGLKHGPYSSIQSSLILPMPGDTNLYYIFTATGNYFYLNTPTDTGYYYSIFDRRLNGGHGDVTGTKNVRLYKWNTGALAATHNARHNGFWIVTHGQRDSFVCYQLTAAGLSAPVYSRAGGLWDTTFLFTRYNLGISFTMDGQRLTYPVDGGRFAICDFDPATGRVSGAITVGPMSSLYSMGISYTIFSPDGTRLYATENNRGILWQFDVTSRSPAAILASRYTVDSAGWLSTYGCMQNGPDGKIYVARFQTEELGVIQHPDAAGAQCAFAPHGYSLGHSTVLFGLPNVVFSSFGPPLCQPSNTPINGAICVDLPYDFHGRQLSSPGIYRDTFQTYYGCDSVITLYLTVQPAPQVSLSLRPMVQHGYLHVSGTDTFTCLGDPSFLLSGGYPAGGTYSGADVTGYRFQHTGMTATTSAISYTYTDTNGCSALARKVIKVEDCTAGIPDMSATGTLHIYPEPNSGTLTLQTAATHGSYYIIRDLSGAVVMHGAITQEQQRIDMTGASSGTYLLTVVADEKVETVKVTIAR